MPVEHEFNRAKKHNKDNSMEYFSSITADTTSAPMSVLPLMDVCNASASTDRSYAEIAGQDALSEAQAGGSLDEVGGATIGISFIRNHQDNWPQMRRLSLQDFIKQLEKHPERIAKNGPAFIPAVFKEGSTRASVNVVELTALVLDIDDGTPYKDIFPLLEPFAHVFHTSHSHTPELHKYRVVVFLAEPIPAQDWPEFWLRARQYFGHMDPSTKDPARLYYLPAHPPGAREFGARYHHGRLLCSDDLPALPQESKEKIRQRASLIRSGVEVFQAQELAELGIEGIDELKPEKGLAAVVERCAFMLHASHPNNQAQLAEPEWMAMITNACGFDQGDLWIHGASEQHDEYDEVDTQSRIERYRELGYAPVTCARIRELGFTGCPAGGCKTSKGAVVGAPAGLWGWAFQRATPVISQGECITEKKRYEVGGFEVSNDGIVYTAMKKDEPEVTRVSLTRIDVVALGRDQESGNWCKRLSLLDPDGVRKTWMMPMEMLGSPRQPYREILLSMGAALCSDKRASQLLAQYLSEATPSQRVLAVQQLGWHGQNFVLPDTFYGPADDQQVVLQSADPASAMVFGQAGTLEGWQQHVATMAQGNSRLMLALCVALTGCVIPLVGEENLGFNLRGASSIGKSLTLKVAASVWGGKGFVRTWNATGNGLQSVAALHNHTFLPLDEMGEAQVNAIGNVVFALGNGLGRIRASQSGEHRAAKKWQLTYLSTSERSLSSIVAEAGQKVLAGQEVRLVEIPADAGKGLGIFDVLNGTESGGELARKLQNATGQHYGHAGRAWVELLADPERQADLLVRIRGFTAAFVDQVVQSGDAGQVGRVATRFALIAGVGEVCCEEGILPWPANSAMTAMRRCLEDWVDQRGGRGELEQDQAIAVVREFLMRHGDSRFENKSYSLSSIDRPIYNRAGFIGNTHENTGKIFYISADVFKSEVCGGMDAKCVTQALAAQEFLVLGKGGNQHRIRDGKTRTYYYAVSDAILGEYQAPKDASPEVLKPTVSELACDYIV